MIKKLLVLLIATLTLAKELMLVAITHQSCPVCQQWHKEVAPIYPDQALQKHLPFLKEYDVASKADRQWVSSHIGVIQYLPTFVVMDGDYVVEKFVGYTSVPDFFKELNEVLMKGEAASAS